MIESVLTYNIVSLYNETKFN